MCEKTIEKQAKENGFDYKELCKIRNAMKLLPNNITIKDGDLEEIFKGQW